MCKLRDNYYYKNKESADKSSVCFLRGFFPIHLGKLHICIFIMSMHIINILSNKVLERMINDS